MPATAPAQHRLAYAAISVTGKLWRMNLRTGERRIIVDSRYGENIPQYSPDGRKLAFQSERSGNFEVWTCDADGTNCQQLTFFQGPQGGTPRWSPDGRWIALDSRAEGTAQIYVMASDGGKPRRVTSGDAQNQVPSWSHDGRWIYFESDRSGQWRIWKVPPEGGSAVQVTKNTGGAAFESVDGKYLYIHLDREQRRSSRPHAGCGRPRGRGRAKGGLVGLLQRHGERGLFPPGLQDAPVA